MKKLISSSMLGVLLLTTSVTPAYAVQKPELKTMTVQSAFTEFKKTVFLEGKELEIATEVLVSKLIDAKITTGQLELYVAKNSTKEGYKKYNEMMKTALEDVDSLNDLSKDDLSFILKSTLEKTHATGSNFMSCAAGQKIGLPLLAVGVIIGIVSLVNATASKEMVTQEFLDKKRNKTQDYLNTIADLELEVTTYESDIIYYQDEIDELNRRINSGEYTSEEIEQMYLLIRDYEFFISDSHALIGEVNVDIAYFENQYATDLVNLEANEVSELARVDEKKASAAKTGIAAGIIGGVGVVFAAAGLSDCN
ncbi:MAG: hypothetical protein N4A33_07680 [Bacteriovoracaceae bacterium]|jgi:hypothetical protein|nr:hypothetical protein [Bacteriovoracaceae bacterium]